MRNGDSLRIVLDSTSAAEPETFSLAPNSEFGERLVLDLYDKTGVSRARALICPKPTGSEARRDIVVAISAGHGGEDPGSIGYDGRIKEKNVTLAISQALHECLENCQAKPVMIREGDYYAQSAAQRARWNRKPICLLPFMQTGIATAARARIRVRASGDRADRENSARVAEKANMLICWGAGRSGSARA